MANKPVRQCGSCEATFISSGDVCPCCGSGNWVWGYIDEPKPIFNPSEKWTMQS